MSQILWLIVASAAASLVYHIPECKPNLGSPVTKSAVPFGHGFRILKTKTPGHEAGRPVGMKCGEARQTVDFATTTLRQGLSTAIASAEAMMLAPAAMMNTLSQVPDDCCM